MRLIVGLGNPGVTYTYTRHNIGFRVVEELARELVANDFRYKQDFEAEISQVEDLMLVLPQTFMNRSGWTVQRIAGFYKVGLEDIYVIHDDLDLRLGTFKLQLGKGPKIHNGILSVEQHLGHPGFWRMRVGVDNREQGDRSVKGEDYVLGKFKPLEEEVVQHVIRESTHVLLEQLGKSLLH